jgi:proline dehydrogenase
MQIFENTEIAFKHRSDKELKKARVLFKYMSYPVLVRIAGLLVRLGISLRLPLKWIVKPTVFNHFCGGENLAESGELIDFLAKFKVRSVLDFAAEKQDSEQKVQPVIAEIIKTIEFSAGHPSVAFSVFKPSALAPEKVLSRAGSSGPEGEKLVADIEKFMNCIRTLCKASFKKGIPVMIDAEESHYQDIVDKVAAEMMELYNKERAMVFNTVQMYRHDRLEFLKGCIGDSLKKNYHLGLKIVRGAYMDQERARAIKMGYPSPIYPDKKSTDEAFDQANLLCLQNIDSTSLFVGTHNEDSLIFLMDKMREYGLNNDDPRIYVSQLYGMSDHISFNMAHASYNVAKYLPYGPVRYLLPYLIRRAEENKSVTGEAGRELRFVNLELKRRQLLPNSN